MNVSQGAKMDHSGQPMQAPQPEDEAGSRKLDPTKPVAEEATTSSEGGANAFVHRLMAYLKEKDPDLLRQWQWVLEHGGFPFF